MNKKNAPTYAPEKKNRSHSSLKTINHKNQKSNNGKSVTKNIVSNFIGKDFLNNTDSFSKNNIPEKTALENIAPHKKPIGAFRSKVIMKDYVSTEGKSALYLQCFLLKKRIRILIGVEIEPHKFDKNKQIVKGKSIMAYDTNLLINKAKARANQIAIHFRLQERVLTADLFISEFTNPTPSTDFILYVKWRLKKLEEFTTKRKLKNKYVTLNKLIKYKPEILFSEITEEFVKKWSAWMKTKQKNSANTIKSNLGRFKTLLNDARRDGIIAPLNPNRIRGLGMSSKIVFLEEAELAKMIRYYNSEFCPSKHKDVLQYFLFVCFSGLRFSDVTSITHSNIINNFLVFMPGKTESKDTMQKIKLNATIKKFIGKYDDNRLFNRVISNQKTNDNLKEIAKLLKIPKHITFHVSRHTFATTFIRLGGNVTVLQKLLGHSKITETMIYVHVNDEYVNEQIMLLDKIKSED